MLDYSVGDVVEGCVERITPIGAYVDIGPDVKALLHISELPFDFGSSAIEDILVLRDERAFKIIQVVPELSWASLSMRSIETSR